MEKHKETKYRGAERSVNLFYSSATKILSYSKTKHHCRCKYRRRQTSNIYSADVWQCEK